MPKCWFSTLILEKSDKITQQRPAGMRVHALPDGRERRDT
jgi:hypothetical protein